MKNDLTIGRGLRVKPAMTVWSMTVVLLFFFFGTLTAYANEEKPELNVRDLILEHVSDGYDWHITTVGHTHISIPLPVIVKGKESGWHVFSSARFHHGHDSYKGFHIAQEGPYEGKIVETIAGQTPNDSETQEVRPWDFSLTKNATSLVLSSILLIILVLSCAQWYRKRAGHPEEISPKGFIALMEMLITNLVDEVIKPSIGKSYRKYVPYLLTVFFFIFMNNLLGLIPIFPGGANVTGNIAITFILALCTFLIVNLFGTKEYWKEIFWPDVPIWLKIPPIIPMIELIGIFTKPFALMVRLFANILAGHSIVLGLTCIIFLTVSLGVYINSGMIVFSLVMSLFISFIELLVAFIQAYVFTMLSAVFIGLSQIEAHRHA
jgi:F-type H+-transporting ATPase subunit a